MTVLVRQRLHGTTYYVRHTWQGRRYVEPAGHDRREAERLDARRKREVRDGTYRPPEARRLATVADYAERWLATRATRTADNDAALLRRHVLSRPWFASLLLTDLRPRHLGRLVEELHATVSERTGRTLAPKSVGLIWSALRTMMRDARIAEVIDHDPCVLPRGAVSARARDPRGAYTLDECRALLGQPGAPERAWSAVALLTGCRLGEIAGLQWGDLDTEPQPLAALHVRRQYDGRATKTNRERVAPVHPLLAAELAAWRTTWEQIHCRAPAPSDPLLPTQAGTVHARSSAYKAWRRACAGAGVANRSAHSTRHTFITLCRRGGADPAVVERVTHNARGTVVDVYTHRDWLELCEAVLAWGQRGTPGGTATHPPHDFRLQLLDSNQAEAAANTAERDGARRQAAHPGSEETPANDEGAAEWAARHLGAGMALGLLVGMAA